MHSRADTAGRPNILWICTDQQRYDTVNTLGNPEIHTSNLDRLAREGVSFTHTYCQNPVCQPSRASFLTGLYPSTVHDNRNGNAYFIDRFKLITRRLADAGYDCGLAGKLHIASPWHGREQRADDGYRVFHFSHSPSQGIGRGNEYTDWIVAQGHSLDEVFEEHYVGHPDNKWGRYRPDMPVHLHQTVWCADMAIDFIRETRDRPWLMSVNPYDPHFPFDAPLPYERRYDPQRLSPPLFRESDLELQKELDSAFFHERFRRPDAEIQRIKASYYGMIELIDEQVGRMLEVLEETGQREETLVIFTSDHGEMLGDHGLVTKGCRFYEGAVRVPLIISWPGRFQADVRHDCLVELTDIAPTLAEVAGIPLEWTHGRSLAPMLTGRSSGKDHRRYVRCEYYDAQNPHVGTDKEHTPSYATMHREGKHKLVVYHGLEMGELYDLEKDPGEFDNLWFDPAHQSIKADLLKKSFDASIVIADPGAHQIGRY